MEKLKYIIKKTLACRGAIDQMADESIKNLLVADMCIARWDADQNSYGHNEVSIYPGFLKGEPAFLIKRYWISSAGYSCTGLTGENILNFEQGVKLLIENGAYKHMFVL